MPYTVFFFSFTDLRHEIDVTKKVDDKSPLANSVGSHTPSPKESDTSLDKPKVDSNKLTDSGYVGTSDSYRTPPTKGMYHVVMSEISHHNICQTLKKQILVFTP